ncbi:MAG: S9 family peptidase [Ignavibacteriae bacterium]|nr:S9 family peptidase [Ignavibacteriota bacterium]
MVKKHLTQIAMVVIIITLSCFRVYSQEKVLTPELILTIRTITEVQLSPDGNTIIFQAARSRREDEKPGASISELWRISVAGGEPVRFTYNEKSDKSPQWHPDGKLIAFLSTRGESDKTQLHLIPVDGGEAVPLTKAENSVLAFKWSPDGNRIAYTMTDPKTKEEQQDEKDGTDWIVADQNYKHTRLYVVDVKSKETKLITVQPLTVHGFDWSPDAKQLLIAAAPTPLVDDSYMQVQLYTIPSEGGAEKHLTTTHGKLTHPRWSPDGKWIAWLGAISLNDPFAGSVFAVSAAGGAGVNLTPDYEGTATWLGWQPGKPATIVFTAIERQSTVLKIVSPTDRTIGALVTQPIIVFGAPSFSRDGKWMALAANTPQHPNEIFYGKVLNKPLRRLTRFNPQLDGLQLGKQEVIRWKSIDGWDIEGVLVKPVGYVDVKRYPAVMQVHGGPEAADVNGWLGTYSRWGQMLAGRGFAVLYPNYRGSIGRGVKFAMADQRDMMGKEFHDMLAGIDYLVSEGIADPDRIGIGGGSYGGFTSAWAATAGSERFKAAIMWMGISNNISKMGTTDIFWESSRVHWNEVVYDNFDLFWQRSPIAHIKNAQTPTLIIHGKDDPRVPISQSMEMYTALKWKGAPVEFVTYPREGHGVSERAHQLDFMKRVNNWFERYLKNKLTGE